MQEQGPGGAYGRGVARVARVVDLLRRGEGRRMVSDTVRTVRRRARTVREVDDLPSRLRMARLVAETTLGREDARPPAASAIPVVATSISARPVWLRPRSRDHAAFAFLQGRHHLPPPELVDPPKHVAVLGANIGLVAAELASLYPEARLLAVEPDPQNAALARRNLAHLGDRVTLVEKAVWWRDERIQLAWGRDAWGLNLTGASADQEPGSGRTVDAVDVGRLLDGFTGGAELDYLLMNIESGWYELVRHGEWTRNVRCLKVEIQSHYDEAPRLLRALGYRVRLERLQWGAFAVGIRP